MLPQIDLSAIGQEFFHLPKLPLLNGTHRVLGAGAVDRARHFFACPTPTTGQCNEPRRGTIVEETCGGDVD